MHDCLKPCRDGRNVLGSIPQAAEDDVLYIPSHSVPYGTDIELIDDDDMESAVVPLPQSKKDATSSHRNPLRERRSLTQLLITVITVKGSDNLQKEEIV